MIQNLKTLGLCPNDLVDQKTIWAVRHLPKSILDKLVLVFLQNPANPQNSNCRPRKMIIMIWWSLKTKFLMKPISAWVGDVSESPINHLKWFGLPKSVSKESSSLLDGRSGINLSCRVWKPFDTISKGRGWLLEAHRHLWWDWEHH